MENRKILNRHSLSFRASEASRGISVLMIILLAVLARLIPHPPNFAPIAGLALFSGSNFKNKISLLIPLAAMILSDIFLGFHSTIFYVYISFILITLIGRKIKSLKFSNLFLASLLSSILFFLITNFGVWATGSMYPKTFDGLIQSYVMGLPFFRNTVLGDLFYSFSFFYGFEFLSKFIHKNFIYPTNY